MLKSIETALKLSTIRERLNDLNAIADQTDAQITEERSLVAELKTSETEYRESLQAEDDARTTPTAPDAETRERLQMVSRASLGAIFSAAVEHRSTEGAESELQRRCTLALLRSRSISYARPSRNARSRRHRRTSARPSNRS